MDRALVAAVRRAGDQSAESAFIVVRVSVLFDAGGLDAANGVVAGRGVDSVGMRGDVLQRF